MLIVGVKPDHDGGFAVLRDGRLELTVECEKDSYARHAHLHPYSLAQLADRLDACPDVFSIGGWHKDLQLGNQNIGAGYIGLEPGVFKETKFFGKPAKLFTSSHERSHVLMAIGMAPDDGWERCVVLVWEGLLGSFYVVNRKLEFLSVLPAMMFPGVKYGFLFSLANPNAPETDFLPNLANSGKLMALAAYGNAANVEPDVARDVDRLLKYPMPVPSPKREFRDSRLYNCGVEHQLHKDAAALLTKRIFERFVEVASMLPRGLPLRISGGCGLNCDWNSMWRESGLFSSVFVPPCTNDSGTPLGTAIDAYFSLSGKLHIDWDVYAGTEFEWDADPAANGWREAEYDRAELVDALDAGRVVAWVEGRYEIGPRALGHRSLIADARSTRMRDRLNEIKRRDSYRPVAPICREEDIGKAFDRDFVDRHMLYFRRVKDPSRIAAITHVDGSARVQVVIRHENRRLHELLSVVAARHGLGVLCNTSLNFPGRGFINRMTDLVHFCKVSGIEDMVIDGKWFRATSKREGAG